ncbi:MAG: endonuclease III [Clostridiales bacterium]|nr:endonuclease III [Clostridiales bacterium]
MKIENTKKIFNLLQQMHPHASCELNFKSIFELLVAVILSAQCTDRRVNIITEKLFQSYNKPSDFAYLNNDDLAPMIFSCGFYSNKGKNIIDASRIIHEKYSDTVPNSMEELLALPGVGRKTASVILSVGYGIPAIPVDTHVFRVANRIGLSKGSTPNRVEKDLKELFERDNWNKLHNFLVFHGRYICKSQKPKCDKCLLSQECFYNKSKTK